MADMEKEFLQAKHRLEEAQAMEFDAEELTDARMRLRPDLNRSTVFRIQKAYDTQYSPFTMAEARRDVSEILEEHEEKPRSVREWLRNHQLEQTASARKRKNGIDKFLSRT